MDEQKKLAIIERLQSLVVDSTLSSTNPAAIQGIGDAIQNPELILDKDDSFHFDKIRCDDCSKHCCYSSEPRQILVMPCDIDVMLASERFKKQDRAIFIKKYFTTYLGGQSHVPLGMVNLLPSKEGTYFCYLLDIAFNGKKEKIITFHSKKKMKCVFERERRPFSCALYPLGRFSQQEEILKKEGTFLLSPDCDAINSSKTITVKEYIKPLIGRWEQRDKYMIEMAEMARSLILLFKEDLASMILDKWKDFLFLDERHYTQKMKLIRHEMARLVKIAK